MSFLKNFKSLMPSFGKNTEQLRSEPPKREEKPFTGYTIQLINSGLTCEEPPPDILDMAFDVLGRYNVKVLRVTNIVPDVYELRINKPIPQYLTYVPKYWDLGDWTIFWNGIEIPLFYTDSKQDNLTFFPPVRGGYNSWFKQQEETVPKFSLEEKMKHCVFETEKYAFLKIPEDETFIRREGIDMQHCLSVSHVSYCDRMKKGEIALYSMIEKDTGKARVDIEIALEIPSYNRVKVVSPSVTQIRGPKNQCPPDDELLLSLMKFFARYGKEKGYVLAGHGYKNFDGRLDGDLLCKRFMELRKL